MEKDIFYLCCVFFVEKMYKPESHFFHCSSLCQKLSRSKILANLSTVSTRKTFQPIFPHKDKPRALCPYSVLDACKKVIIYHPKDRYPKFGRCTPCTPIISPCIPKIFGRSILLSRVAFADRNVDMNVPHLNAALPLHARVFTKIDARSTCVKLILTPLLLVN